MWETTYPNSPYYKQAFLIQENSKSKVIRIEGYIDHFIKVRGFARVTNLILIQQQPFLRPGETDNVHSNNQVSYSMTSQEVLSIPSKAPV